MTSAIVIGAGMGGLATALRLQKQGFQVQVFEKQARPGGRSYVIEEAGFRVDRGPTILVMKSAFEATYQALGYRLDERLEMTQLDPNYRIYFHDNTFLDLYNNMRLLAEEVEKIEAGSTENLYRFLGSAAKKYALGMDFVSRNYDRITDLANPSAALKLLNTASYEKLYRQVSKFFQSDKLRKAFSFHSMFLGLSPYESLAMYTLITYADLVLGMWYPKGGIYSIIEDFLRIADEIGVEIHTNSPIAQIIVKDGKACGVRLESGKEVLADMVISNADLPYTYQCLVAPEYRRQYTDRKLQRMKYSCSGYLLYLGVNKTYPNARHQGLYFAEDYRRNLDSIFVHKTLPDDPSFHLNVPTVTDSSLAPEGHSVIYLLAPMPNLTGDVDWQTAAPIVRNQLLDKLETLIDPAIRDHIVWEKSYTPLDFQTDMNAMYGTAFGSLSQGLFQSAYFRPHNKAHDIQNLYFVGQGTYPGIGMPMVLISAGLVTERVMQEWG